MISATDVYSALCNYSDAADFTQEQLLPSCEDGLNWVIRRLRDSVDENDPLIKETAAAIAHFFFFIRKLTEPEKYENFKIGDMTIKNNLQKQYQMEKEMRQQAIINAAPILKDGGFFFCGN